mgnify:CR=1 FL=1
MNKCAWYNPRISVWNEQFGCMSLKEVCLHIEASHACLEREDHATMCRMGFATSKSNSSLFDILLYEVQPSLLPRDRSGPHLPRHID